MVVGLISRPRIAFAISLVVGLLLGVAAAEAWSPVNFNCTQSPETEYRFVDWGTEQPPSAVEWDNLTHTDWNATTRDNFSKGADNWEEVVNPNGNKVVNVSENTGSGGIPFWHVDLDTSGGGGKVVCHSGNLYGAVDFTESGGGPLATNAQRGLATHEMGHALGNWHAGSDDNRWAPSYEPTMIGKNTVNTRYENFRSLTPDDWINLTWSNKTYDNLTANPYFNQGTELKGWKVDSGSLVYHSSGGVNGTPYGKMQGADGVIKSPAFVWFNSGLEIESKVKAQVFDESARASGYVKIVLWTKELDATGTADPYEFLTNPVSKPNINEWSQEEVWTIRSLVSIIPTEEWTAYATSSYTLPSSYIGAGVRISIENTLETSGGGAINAWIDNARVQRTP